MKQSRAPSRLQAGEVIYSREITRQNLLEEGRKTLKLGLPIVAGQLAYISLGFIDTVMAGNLSAADLGAVAIGRSLYMPLFVAVLGILLAVSPIVAQFYGAGERLKIGKTVRQGLWLCFLITLPCFILVRSLHHLLPLMHVAERIVPISSGYLDAVSWGLFPAFAYLVLRFFNEGISISKPHMYFSLAAIPLNIAGNYVFMYGKLGFPRLGAIGTGWATALVWWFLFVGMLILTARGKSYRPFRIYHDLQWPNWRYLREILRIGIPNGVSVGMEISMFAIAALLIGTLGVSAIAGHQVALNFASITFMVPLGLSMATTSRVGYAVGQNNFAEARAAGYAGMALSVLAMLISATVMISIPEWIAGIYTNDPGVKAVAVQLLFFAAMFQISDGLQVSGAGALRGLKDTKIPMVVNLTAYWVIGLPLGYYLAMKLGYGARGFWMGMVAGLTFAAIFHPARFHRMCSRPAGSPGKPAAAPLDRPAIRE